MFKFNFIVLLAFVVVAVNLHNCDAQKIYTSNAYYSTHNPNISTAQRLLSGQQISMEFFTTLERSDQAKKMLQDLLHNFLEILQRNLTTSSVLNTMANTIDLGNSKRQLEKLNQLSDFFQTASEMASIFASEAEQLFEAAKNESENFLLKLRHVPTGSKGTLPMEVKTLLTDYFAEMEFFHIMFSEIIDISLEYIVDTLHAMQNVFIIYTDIQRDVLHNWNFKPDIWCCNRYMDFLQHWSAEIFKCAAGNELQVAYDVYAITELSIKYILQQQEFRIQRLFNCFILGDYKIRCGFLRNAEKDFEKLFAKIDELEMYQDIATKHGRITAYRLAREHREIINDAIAVTAGNESIDKTEEQGNKCIPYGFPDSHMPRSLKSCFYFPDFN